MMQHFRRLPPLLRALWLLGLLFLLVSLGVEAWVVFREQGLSTARGQDLFLTFVLLSFACNWPVAVYNARFIRPGRALPWLDAWWGQLAAAVGFAVLPLGFVAAVLLIPPRSPLVVLQGLLFVLAALVWLATYAWATSPPVP